MAIINILMIYFYILQPNPHNSMVSEFASVLDPPMTMGLYAKGDRAIEIKAGVSISAGFLGYLHMAGAPSISVGLRDGRNMYELTALAANDNGALAGAYTRVFNIKGKEYLARISGNMLRYYELSDRYSFYSADASFIVPFSWGSFFKPFIGIEGGAGIMDYPDNIMTGLIPGFDLMLIHGLNFQAGAFNMSYYCRTSINDLNWGLSAGTIF